MNCVKSRGRVTVSLGRAEEKPKQKGGDHSPITGPRCHHTHFRTSAALSWSQPKANVTNRTTSGFLSSAASSGDVQGTVAGLDLRTFWACRYFTSPKTRLEPKFILPRERERKILKCHTTTQQSLIPLEITCCLCVCERVCACARVCVYVCVCVTSPRNRALLLKLT